MKDAVLEFILSNSKKESAVSKIWLFGSRGKGNFTETSDYDLAFVWLKDDLAWGGFATDLREKNPSLNSLDLVRIDQISSEFKNRILSEGTVIYEKV